MFNKLLAKGKYLSEKVSTKPDESDSSSVLSNLMDDNSIKDKAQALFDEHWDKIEAFLIKGLLGVAEEKLQDEEFMSTIFEKAYELLPTIVRLVISRKTFFGFIEPKRNDLMIKIGELRDEWVETENLEATQDSLALLDDNPSKSV